jgi:hypothetical protein
MFEAQLAGRASDGGRISQMSTNSHIGPPSLARPANKFERGLGFYATPTGRAREKTVLGLIIICVALLCISWQFGLIPRAGRPIRAGQDLLGSYAAGQIVRQGHATDMYDRHAVAATEQRIMQQNGITGDSRFLPWMNPPFAALPFVPLAAMPYRPAVIAWLAINIALAGICLSLLGGMLPEDLSRPRTMLLWLAIVFSMPFWQAMYAQQNTFVSLVLLCSVTHCWLSGRGFWAGVFVGLMLFKPQLAMVIAAVLGISMGAEAIVGFGVVAIGLPAITAWTLPGTLTAYLHQLPPTIHWLQMELHYNWGRQTTLQGFWRLAIQGHAAGETALLARLLAGAGAAAFGIPLVIAAWRTRGGDRSARRRLIAAAIVATPLIAPYYMDYDLLLLAVGAVLTITEKPPLSGGLMGKGIAAAWFAVAIALYLNPFIAADGRWNVAVIAIVAMAVLLLRNVFAHLPRPTAIDRPCPAAPASALSR